VLIVDGGRKNHHAPAIDAVLCRGAVALLEALAGLLLETVARASGLEAGARQRGHGADQPWISQLSKHGLANITSRTNERKCWEQKARGRRSSRVISGLLRQGSCRAMSEQSAFLREIDTLIRARYPLLAEHHRGGGSTLKPSASAF